MKRVGERYVIMNRAKAGSVLYKVHSEWTHTSKSCGNLQDAQKLCSKLAKHSLAYEYGIFDRDTKEMI